MRLFFGRRVVCVRASHRIDLAPVMIERPRLPLHLRALKVKLRLSLHGKKKNANGRSEGMGAGAVQARWRDDEREGSRTQLYRGMEHEIAKRDSGTHTRITAGYPVRALGFWCETGHKTELGTHRHTSVARHRFASGLRTVRGDGR